MFFKEAFVIIGHKNDAMYIEEVIIDGFKSYCTKVTVGPFDPQFNAITGLNGTGKSNILDSICFVLGISNLAQIRVDNLTQLVYKNGQAGVTKASVTVIFNNQDKSGAPMGYEKCDKLTICRQIVIGGRNRYMLNGVTVQQTQIANLFHSVQLNVNNPHFLIMQGRITKVINMKPAETLSMIEEAAGTRMYESKKNSAIGVMQKKESKVLEINNMLSETIGPALEKLVAERQNYMKWTSNQNLIDQLTRFVLAGDYTKWKSRYDLDAAEKMDMELTIVNLLTHQTDMNQKREEIAKDIVEKEEKGKELDVGDIEEKHSKLHKLCASTEAKVKNSKKEVEKELKNEGKAVDTLKKFQDSVEEKKQEIKEKTEEAEVKDKEVDEAREDLGRIERSIAAVQAGMVEADDGAKSIKESLVEAKAALATLAQEKETRVAKVDADKNMIAQSERQLQECNKEGLALANLSQKLEEEVKRWEKKVNDIKFDEAAHEANKEKKAAMYTKMNEVQETVEGFRRSLHNVEFVYTDPEPGFDRSRVKGKSATLFKVKRNFAPYSKAMERVAGAKLFFVIVDTNHTSSLLIDRNCFSKRTNFIPLNNITSRPITDKQFRVAQEIVGRDKVFRPIDCLDYDPAILPAMNFIFGNALLCDGPKTAKLLAFDPRVNIKCVTQDGDVYDPSGILSGGAAAFENCILDLMTKFTLLKEDLTKGMKEYQELERVVRDGKALWIQWVEAKKAMKDKQHELMLLKNQIQTSEHGRHADELAKMKKIHAEDIEYVKNAPKLMKDTKAKVHQLELDIADHEKSKDEKTAALKKKAQAQKTEVKKKEQAVKASKELVTTAELELEILMKDMEGLTSAQTAKANKLDEKKKSLAELEETLEKQNAELAGLASSREELKEQKKRLEDGIQEQKNEQGRLKKEADQAEVEMRKLKHQVDRYDKNNQEAAETLKDMEKKYPWILEEKGNFGKKDSDFDFEKNNIGKSKKKLQVLETENQTLERNLNKKVMNMYDKAKEDYDDLLVKRDTIIKDKEKIVSVIKDLDVKKKEAIMCTWTQVNKDFGSIFGSLLPGTNAKLDPPDGIKEDMEITGLEIKVAFHDVWKQSLSELSGGQRSLLALSLVLALLRFKPAPMYILDEVDAALDLSHTQNIGHMIKTHFPDSQFIVVSLKQGMFDNANVLFRTAFVDGCSQVKRTGINSRKRISDDELAPIGDKKRARKMKNEKKEEEPDDEEDE